jgi:phosphoribosylformimino-5-aminoimidazole carboxamide ribotide isomerase
LAEHAPIPCVYAGGVRDFQDLEKLNRAGNGTIDVTVGSALDIFGGTLPFGEVVEFCRNT